VTAVERRGEGSRRAQAWRRRFRRLLRLDRGNRRLQPKPAAARAKGQARKPGSGWFGRALRAVGRGLCYLLVAGAFGALPVGALFGYRWLVASPHFLVRQVTVTGNDRLSSDAVVAAAGLNVPVSTLAMDGDEVAAALRGVDRIRSAEVTVELPSTVTVTVSERQPAALVALGRLYVVDDRGAVFRPLGRSERVSLPILTGFDRVDLTDPGRQSDTRRRIREALSLLRAWEETGLAAAAPLSDVEIDPVYGHIARTAADGTEIWLGRGADLRPRLERLADVLLDLRLRGHVAQTIYLDAPDAAERVVVRSEEIRSGSPLLNVAGGAAARL
jgi:cell division protein FtsQ